MASHALPFCLYLFNRGGELLTYIEWSRPRAPANLQHDGKMSACRCTNWERDDFVSVSSVLG